MVAINGHVDKNKRHYNENRIFVKNYRDGKENRCFPAAVGSDGRTP